MKKIYISGLLICLVVSVFAQKTTKLRPQDLAKSNPDKIEFMKGIKIICPGNVVDANTYVPFAKEVEQAIKNKANLRATAKSTFLVTYTGFSPQAQQAFQLAVDIWSNIISSPVPIRINAVWHPIDSGNQQGTILGQASPATFSRNFPGQQKAGTWYPIALAEKISGQELNSINESDIDAEFNSSANWYLGTGVPSSSQYDFTSVVLHELCHGLGFTSSLRSTSTTTTASWGYETGSPFIFDHFVQNGTGQQLIDTKNFANPSSALRQQLVGNSLYFASPIAAANGTEKPRLYAPLTYQAGSSTSHLNDPSYPSGNENSLMTSTASQREVIRDPGPLVRNIFADMGWWGTSLLHTRIKNIEAVVSSVTVTATIKSDTSITAGSAKVYYTQDDTLMANAKAIDLKRVGTTDQYTAVIPVSRAGAVIRYYLVTEDGYKRRYTSPAEAPTRGYYGFSVGVEDKSKPFISSIPLNFISGKSVPDIIANVDDDYQHGIDTVYVEYLVNGQARASVGLKKYNPATDDPKYSQGQQDAYAYLAKEVFKNLKVGDRVLYRVVAVDKSKNKNVGILPAYMNTPGVNVEPTPDYFEFVVTELKSQTPVQTYSNDFNSPTDDFATIGGWGVAQPNGFSNGALHSAHPYKNGGDENLEANTIAMLLRPIELKAQKDSATIIFDEVVLVEPGENGIAFGDLGFYDYVVVEGSYDGGISWVPFEDGYDASANSDWLRTFNSSSATGTVVASDGTIINSKDSKALGSSALYRSRTVKMLNSGDFVAGDVVLIRFRLYSDELSYGWGWAIDNLKIQLPGPPPVLAVEPTLDKTLTLAPNPAPDEIQIITDLAKPGRVRMEVISASGKKIMERDYLTDIPTFYQKIDVSTLSAGTYLVRLHTENGTVVKRFVVSR